MISKLEWLIARRYLTSKHKDSFISMIGAFSFIGIMLGVATLIIVMSVMKGYETELIKRILGINSHIVISNDLQSIPDYHQKINVIKKIKNIQHIAPVISGQAMANNHDTNISSGAIIQAIDGNDLINKPVINTSIIRGDIKDYIDNKGVLIGNILANNLQINVGDTLRLLIPQSDTTILGSIPRSKTFDIVGIFDVGMYEYNSSTIFMPLKSAQTLFKKKDTVSKIEIITSAPDQLFKLKKQIFTLLGDDYYINDWTQTNQSLINALTVERNVMFLILTLIIIVAAFNIISSLVMLVKDKTKNIAILKTIGMDNSSVIKIFILCGTIIGFIGTILGTFLGLLFCYNINSIKSFLESLIGISLFDPIIYFLTTLPVELDLQNIVVITIMALFLSFLATIYPAWKASKLMPTQVLRYE